MLSARTQLFLDHTHGLRTHTQHAQKSKSFFFFLLGASDLSEMNAAISMFFLSFFVFLGHKPGNVKQLWVYFGIGCIYK